MRKNQTSNYLQTSGPAARGAAGKNVSIRQESRDYPMTIYAVSKVLLDHEGRVKAVLWGQVNTGTNDWTNGEAVAPVKDVVEAIHNGDAVFALFPSEHGHLPERRFMAVEYDSGWETIALEGDPTYEREVHDMDRLDA
jgi:hypothetical protein